MTIQFRSFSLELHSPHLPIKEVALKEWAVCIEALSSGEQILLVRKGGLSEETREFRLEDTSFYLYPTYEHQKKELIKKQYHDQLDQTLEGRTLPLREVTITHVAHVVDDIAIRDDEAALKHVSDFHIYTPDYAAQRLQWNADKPLHLLTVRAYRLSEPKTIEVKDTYKGCTSWLTLAHPLEQFDLEPVLSQEAFEEQRQQLFDALGIQGHH